MQPDVAVPSALERYGFLNRLSEQAFDDITLLASQIFEMPIVLITVIEKDCQWFKSKIGLEFGEIPLEQSFCTHAILEPNEIMTVQDASTDSRFADNPLVLGDPSIRFYAGAPLVTSDGLPFGTVCVLDRIPKQIEPAQSEALKALARLVMSQLEMGRITRQLQASEDALLETNGKLEQLSLTDMLTGIANRRALEQRSTEEFSRASRIKLPLSVLMIDIDHFKVINDQFGHSIGDSTLQAVANVLRSSVRAHDFVARFGGEEFCVILPDTDALAALAVAEHLRLLVAAMQHNFTVTISLGVATETEFNSWTALIERADQALYRAKQQGRNQSVVG